jgi:hypothetical protein
LGCTLIKVYIVALLTICKIKSPTCSIKHNGHCVWKMNTNLLGTSKENVLLKTSRISQPCPYIHTQCYNINVNVLIFRGSWIGLCLGVKKELLWTMKLLDLVVWILFHSYLEWTNNSCVIVIYKQGSSYALCFTKQILTYMLMCNLFLWNGTS